MELLLVSAIYLTDESSTDRNNTTLHIVLDRIWSQTGASMYIQSLYFSYMLSMHQLTSVHSVLRVFNVLQGVLPQLGPCYCGQVGSSREYVMDETVLEMNG